MFSLISSPWRRAELWLDATWGDVRSFVLQNSTHTRCLRHLESMACVANKQNKIIKKPQKSATYSALIGETKLRVKWGKCQSITACNTYTVLRRRLIRHKWKHLCRCVCRSFKGTATLKKSFWSLPKTSMLSDTVKHLFTLVMFIKNKIDL